MARAEVDAEIDDVPDFLVDHPLGKAKVRDLGADHAAGEAVAIEHGYAIAERHEVACDREGRGTRSDARHAAPVGIRGGLREALADVLLVIGRDALQAADRDRLGLLPLILFDATAPARGLARAIAGASEDAGKDVRFQFTMYASA